MGNMNAPSLCTSTARPLPVTPAPHTLLPPLFRLHALPGTRCRSPTICRAPSEMPARGRRGAKRAHVGPSVEKPGAEAAAGAGAGGSASGPRPPALCRSPKVLALLEGLHAMRDKDGMGAKAVVFSQVCCCCCSCCCCCCCCCYSLRYCW
jgi:hypothetical protein